MKNLLSIRLLRASAALPLFLAIAACGSDDAAEGADGTEEIDVDPAKFGSIDTSPEAVDAAKQAALQLVGGAGAMRQAPAARAASGELSDNSVISQAFAAAGIGSGGTDCAAIATYGDEWVDTLPSGFPLYPESQVIEAAGTDDSGCALRVINFATPVAVQDVMDFYYTRASGEGYQVQRVSMDDEDTLAGSANGRSFMVVGRTRPGGGSDVDLIVGGN